MLDIEKKLARKALKDVLGIRNEDYAGKYKSLAKGFGSRIMNNTLLGAMAFLASKGGSNPNKEHAVLFKHISDAIREVADVPWNDSKEYVEIGRLYEDVLNYLSSPENITGFLYIQEMASQYIAYLRRYVAAFIEKEEEAE